MRSFDYLHPRIIYQCSSDIRALCNKYGILFEQSIVSYVGRQVSLNVRLAEKGNCLSREMGGLLWASKFRDEFNCLLASRLVKGIECVFIKDKKEDFVRFWSVFADRHFDPSDSKMFDTDVDAELFVAQAVIVTAAAYGDIESIKLCLQEIPEEARGVVLNAFVHFPEYAFLTNALQEAVGHGHYSLVRVLHELRADVNAADPYQGRTPLHVVASAICSALGPGASRSKLDRYIESYRALLVAGADPDKILVQGEFRGKAAYEIIPTKLHTMLAKSMAEWPPIQWVEFFKKYYEVGSVFPKVLPLAMNPGSIISRPKSMLGTESKVESPERFVVNYDEIKFARWILRAHIALDYLDLGAAEGDEDIVEFQKLIKLFLSDFYLYFQVASTIVRVYENRYNPASRLFLVAAGAPDAKSQRLLIQRPAKFIDRLLHPSDHKLTRGELCFKHLVQLIADYDEKMEGTFRDCLKFARKLRRHDMGVGELRDKWLDVRLRASDSTISGAALAGATWILEEFRILKGQDFFVGIGEGHRKLMLILGDAADLGRVKTVQWILEKLGGLDSRYLEIAEANKDRLISRLDGIFKGKDCTEAALLRYLTLADKAELVSFHKHDSGVGLSVCGRGSLFGGSGGGGDGGCRGEGEALPTERRIRASDEAVMFTNTREVNDVSFKK